MPNDLLVRDVPKHLRGWIKEQSYQNRMTIREFVVSVFEEAAGDSNQMPLFESNRATEPAQISGVPFTFIDLFAGIGGLRIGLERVGGTCIFSSEWDKYSQKTYNAWFGEVPHGDITQIKPSDIPDHDLLAAGFPCQPFSIAGVSKKNSLGKAHGFKCKAQGTLFFQLATIIEVKRPPVIFLENVKNLKSHDQGRTWDVIRTTLEDLKYSIFAEVIDAANWVPQHRERIFIIGFDEKVFGKHPPFRFPEQKSGKRPKLVDILEPNPPAKYTLTDHLWNYLQEYAKRHKAEGNGFGYGLANLEGVTRTLSARYYKDGSEILISQKGKNPRRLTPREAARLMGFPEEYPIVVSDAQAYRQFGNSVVPDVVEAVARQVSQVVSWHLTQTENRCLIKEA